MNKNLILAVFLSTLCTNIYADNRTIRGVNFDPVHSLEFAKAVGLDDKQGMMDALNLDLDKIIELHENGFDNIRYIKTFFASFSSLGMHNQPVTISIADVIHDWNLKHPSHALKLALGVYEFRANIDGCNNEDECKTWTRTQIDTAVESANKYPELIDRIMVGNEDVSDAMRKRVSVDILEIKSKLTSSLIKVGTPQVGGDIIEMFTSNKFDDLKNAADFIGTNVYPYWGGVNYGNAPFEDTKSPAKLSMVDYWNTINKIIGNVEVIGTEEGWPSAGPTSGNAHTGAEFAHDYLYYWYYRDSKIAPISYYFSLFDKLPGQGTESHWGIYSADRNASLLLGSPENSKDFSKPLQKDHPVVRFVNEFSKPALNTVLNACTEDWNAHTKTQGTCYPIGGYQGTGNISTIKDFMIDATGKTYSSLMVLFKGKNGQFYRLCFIDKSTLSKLRNNSTFNLKWRVDDGATPCDLK